MAYKPVDPNSKITKTDETGMVFLGFITLFDPPKPNISETLNQLRKLGVALKIITGDNALVAKSLAAEIGQCVLNQG